jgi:hypothetical protein
MAVETLAQLVEDVRVEAGHALTPAQGLNSEKTLKKLIARTEKELWVAFTWPTLLIRAQVDVQKGQYRIAYATDLPYDQIREVYWSAVGSDHFHKMDYGFNENCIKSDGTNSTASATVQLWEDDGADDTKIRIWPTPTTDGYLRFRGMRPLNALVDDDDVCTLDPTLITLRVSAELLTRAKAEDAQVKMQSFQRHLQKLLANKVSDKHKISTFGSAGGYRSHFTRSQRFVV